MSDLTIEEQAAAMGHVSKEEFRGDPEKWVDAQTFVERGEKIQPVLRERNREMASQITALRQENKIILDQVSRIEKRAYDRAKQEYEEKIGKLNGQELEAVRDGDTDKYQQIQNQKKSLKPPDAPEAPSPHNPEFEEWVANNEWVRTDSEAAQYANLIGPGIASSMPQGASRAQMYARITEEVKKRFPNKFENKNKTKQTVEGETEPTNNKIGKTFSDLPPKAKESYRKLAEDFRHRGHEYSKEDYAKSYWSQ